MPDNKHDGMLEDWIQLCIKGNEQELFQQANNVVESLSNPKFKQHLQTKAKVATWLAWQKMPGHGISCSLKDELLDENNLIYQQLCQWLQHIYGDNMI